MNITEAKHTQDLIAWITALSLFEHDRSVIDLPTDSELTEAAVYLAGRAHAALGAGPTISDVATCMTLLLDEQ